MKLIFLTHRIWKSGVSLNINPVQDKGETFGLGQDEGIVETIGLGYPI